MENDKLVTENLRLVHMCANRFKDRGIEYEELYSAGCLGLVKAAKKYDREKGFAFSTYAVPVILGEIRQCFRNSGSVKVSRDIREKARRCREVLLRLEAEKGREISISELSLELGMDISELSEILNSSSPVISVDEIDESQSVCEKPFESESIDKITVDELLSTLDDDDRKLISLRYFEDKTQVQVANILEMTQVQVSRRERVLLSLMRERCII